MNELLGLLSGLAYGLVIGLIPSAGATTGLIAIFSFVGLFSEQPYVGVIFIVAVIAASTTGDTIAAVVLGIPGANSAAATVVDGFPLALKGQASYALSAAFTASTMNGLLWGILSFALLPFWSDVVLTFGIPELWALTVLAFASVAFLASANWVRGVLAIIFGIWLGLIGYDAAAVPRWTFGWSYLNDGLQIVAIAAGLFALPELIHALISKGPNQRAIEVRNPATQRRRGIRDALLRHRRLSLAGGAIGAGIGVLPGLGGAVADWLAYSHAVRSSPGEIFGDGNIRGVIGCEGANNAQKATSFIPTLLFGIPGAPFAAIMMALFASLNFELGSLELAADTRFFLYLGASFIAATLLAGVICLMFSTVLAKLTQINRFYYFPIIIIFIVWAAMQYTGGWEDLAILLIMTGVGLVAKAFRISRPGILIAFILADRIEKLSWQMTTIYDVEKLVTRPIFLGIALLIIAVIAMSLRTRAQVNYA